MAEQPVPIKDVYEWLGRYVEEAEANGTPSECRALREALRLVSEVERLRADVKRAAAIIRQHEEDADRMNRVVHETEALLRKAGMILLYLRGLHAFGVRGDIFDRLAEPQPRCFKAGDRVRVITPDDWNGREATVRWAGHGAVSLAIEEEQGPLGFAHWELELVEPAD